MLWPAAAATTPPPAPGEGRGANAPPSMTPEMFGKTFPSLTAKDNARIKMLWIVCGTADGLIGVNRQFKDWLRAQNIGFTEQEVPDRAHVWPLWRQNVVDMVPKLFR
jgi:enterochelin esterase family protein